MDERNTNVSDYPRELVGSAAQRAGEVRAWRVRGALIIGAAIVIGSGLYLFSRERTGK